MIRLVTKNLAVVWIGVERIQRSTPIRIRYRRYLRISFLTYMDVSFLVSTWFS